MLAERILQGDIRAAARLMRWADDRDPRATEHLRALFPHTGRAHIVGITGNPGSGKSTLVDALVRGLRREGRRVGVVAVDPSSPYTGGAILGDRIRMQKHAEDPGVFIRSLATRGYLGGLSRSTGDVVSVLDAMGCDVVLIETVGVGQDEVDIVKTAHTSVVVLVPGLGDDIQSMKAGILEIADVFVVNKADRDGADRVVGELQYLQHLSPSREDLRPVPILRAVANQNIGIAEVLLAIHGHRADLEAHGRLGAREETRVRESLRRMLLERFFAHLDTLAAGGFDMDRLVADLSARRRDPYDAVDAVFCAALAAAGPSPATPGSGKGGPHAPAPPTMVPLRAPPEE
ncbi:MAG: methylmalonyl Co-A mutase-associated GTPase MeaB [Deltaproteobacteria bacterium]|nr:methylmalonyl Co-A mutase-associated GTPase MeaB [Deltaproteobacteria bacterium]